MNRTHNRSPPPRTKKKQNTFPRSSRPKNSPSREEIEGKALQDSSRISGVFFRVELGHFVVVWREVKRKRRKESKLKVCCVLRMVWGVDHFMVLYRSVPFQGFGGRVSRTPPRVPSRLVWVVELSSRGKEERPASSSFRHRYGGRRRENVSSVYVCVHVLDRGRHVSP